MINSLDEAIKHCEEVAERKQQEGFFKNTRANTSTVEGSKCYECAQDYRQLAEWLRTLKAYGEARKAIEGTIEKLKKLGNDTYIKGLELAEQVIHELVDEEEYEWDTQ